MPKNKVNNKVNFIAHGSVGTNRKARSLYFIEQTFEAGISLLGSEVKALRMGNLNISDAYVAFKRDELTLINLHIGVYPYAPINSQHSPKRPRILLLRQKELNKCRSSITKLGLTIVPLSIYFNAKGRAKVEIAIAKGKKLYDKRQDIKTREWNRKQATLLKNNR